MAKAFITFVLAALLLDAVDRADAEHSGASAALDGAR